MILWVVKTWTHRKQTLLFIIITSFYQRLSYINVIFPPFFEVSIATFMGKIINNNPEKLILDCSLFLNVIIICSSVLVWFIRKHSNLKWLLTCTFIIMYWPGFISEGLNIISRFKCYQETQVCRPPHTGPAHSVRSTRSAEGSGTSSPSCSYVCSSSRSPCGWGDRSRLGNTSGACMGQRIAMSVLPVDENHCILLEMQEKVPLKSYN